MDGYTNRDTDPSGGVVEGHLNLDGLSNKILILVELIQLVASSGIFVEVDDHTGDKATKRLRSWYLVETIVMKGVKSRVVLVSRGVSDNISCVVVELDIEVSR